MISCPSRTTSRMGVNLEMRLGTAPFVLRELVRCPSRPRPLRSPPLRGPRSLPRAASRAGPRSSPLRPRPRPRRRPRPPGPCARGATGARGTGSPGSVIVKPGRSSLSGESPRSSTRTRLALPLADAPTWDSAAASLTSACEDGRSMTSDSFSSSHSASMVSPLSLSPLAASSACVEEPFATGASAYSASGARLPCCGSAAVVANLVSDFVNRFVVAGAVVFRGERLGLRLNVAEARAIARGCVGDGVGCGGRRGCRLVVLNLVLRGARVLVHRVLATAREVRFEVVRSNRDPRRGGTPRAPGRRR